MLSANEEIRFPRSVPIVDSIRSQDLHNSPFQLITKRTNINARLFIIKRNIKTENLCFSKYKQQIKTEITKPLQVCIERTE